jgi:hypothetical protein
LVVDEAGAEAYPGLKEIEDRDQREHFIAWADLMAKAVPVFHLQREGEFLRRTVGNVFVSSCYNCKELAIWIRDRLVYPADGEAPPANDDMPADIRRDYDEASSILNLSPRGAAALLRLAIQKLCKELGQPGENLNRDIGELVKGGLDPRVQKALDTVRVIGNESVHPGQIDLSDDRATAEALFKLVNLIVEKTISEPKHVEELYASLPPSKVKQIENRDRPKD